MDSHTGLCEGCFRRIEEIAAWSRLGDGAKRQVWLAVAGRARRLLQENPS